MDKDSDDKRLRCVFITKTELHDQRWTQCHSYHPYRGGTNPEFRSDIDGRILALKRGEQYAIDYYINRLHKNLGYDFVICVVPPHTEHEANVGMTRVAQGLIALDGRRCDGTGCLVRTATVEKSTGLGASQRTIDRHIESIEVQNPELIEGRIVLLLDDVCTTGSTFTACRQLLLNAGAIIVYCLAMAETVRDSGYYEY